VPHHIAATSFNPLALLNWLYDAVAWVIIQIHAGLSHLFGPSSGWSWALTIVFLTMLVRLLIFPLFVKQLHAQRKMADLAPKVQELRKKYKNDKQKMNQEVMKLYQENGANPLGGCLPLVAQFPVFIAMFTVLRAIADDQIKYGLTRAVVESAANAHIFGVTISTTFLHAGDFAKHGVNPTVARIVIGITVIISGTTTYLTVRQSMRRGIAPGAETNPMMQSQKMMAYVAPLFALTGLYWPFGLVMYWVTTNLWTMAQQHYIFRKHPQLTPAKATAAKAGGSGAGAPAVGGRTTGSGRASGAGRPAGAGRAGGSGRHGTAGGGAGSGRTGVSGKDTDGQSRPGLGRLLRNRSVPEPEPQAAPEPKVVRQQPVRQSRSKRTGRR